MLPKQEIQRASAEMEIEQSPDVLRLVNANIERIRERTIDSALATLQSERMEIKGQTIEYIDLPPEGNDTFGVPLLYIPGWVDRSQGSVTPLLVDASKRGRRVLSVCNPHGIDTPRIAGYPQAQLRKAMAIIDFLEAQDITQVDAVGHSEGGMVATMIAKLRPGMIRNATLYNPAGLMKNEGVFRLMMGAYKDTKKRKQLYREEEQRNERSQFHRELDTHAESERSRSIRHGFMHSLKEMFSLGRADITKDLRDIQRSDNAQGTRVSLVASRDDKIFPLVGGSWREDLSQRTGIPMTHLHEVRGSHIAHLHDDRRNDEWELNNAIHRSQLMMHAEAQQSERPIRRAA